MNAFTHTMSNTRKAISVALLASLTSLPVIAASQSSALPNGKPFQTLQSEVDNVQSQLDQAVLSLQSQITTAKASITQLQTTTGEQGDAIAAMQEHLALLEQQLNLLQGNLTKNCGDGYFVVEITANGTPVCGRDAGNGLYYQEQEIVAPGIPYWPHTMQCPANFPRIVSGGYVETPTTSVVGTYPLIGDNGQNGWRFVLNGIGAMLTRIVCTAG